MSPSQGEGDGETLEQGDVVAKVGYLALIAGTDEHVRLVEACLHELELFRLSRQLDVLDPILNRVSVSQISD